MRPIVIRGLVRQLGEDDSGRPAVWVESSDGEHRGHHKILISRAECARLAGFLYGREIEIVIRPAADAAVEGQ